VFACIYISTATARTPVQKPIMCKASSEMGSDASDVKTTREPRGPTPAGNLLMVFLFTVSVFILDHFMSEAATEEGTAIDWFLSELVARSCTFDGGLGIALSLLMAHRWWRQKASSKAKEVRSGSKEPSARRPCRLARPDDTGSGATGGVPPSSQQNQRCNELSRWNQAIDQAAQDGEPEKAAALLGLLEASGKCKPDFMSYYFAIRGFAKKGDARGAEKTLNSMTAYGIEASVCCYNIVMDACSKANNLEGCEALMYRMQERGLRPNAISYTTAIHARARIADTVEAERWLHRMEAAGIEPDEVSYNSLIHAFGVRGNALAAEKWVEEMIAHGKTPTVTTFTAVIDACAKAGDAPRAEHWMERLLEAKVEPNVVTFGVVIEACAKAGDAERAERWLDHMRTAGVEPNGHCYSSLITFFTKKGDVVGAERWLVRAEQAGVASDVVLYSGVVDACAKANMPDRAMAVFRRMLARGIKPHVKVFAALALPFARAGNWVTVETIAAEMRKHGVKANEYFLQAQLLSYAYAQPKEGARAVQAFRSGLSQGIEANDHVVVALARSIGRSHCARLMDELCEGRQIPKRDEPRQGSRGDGGLVVLTRQGGLREVIRSDKRDGPRSL